MQDIDLDKYTYIVKAKNPPISSYKCCLTNTYRILQSKYNVNRINIICNECRTRIFNWSTDIFIQLDFSNIFTILGKLRKITIKKVDLSEYARVTKSDSQFYGP